MRVLDQKISKNDLWRAENIFNDEMIKGVVDVRRGILAIDAEMHADLEQFLLAQVSQQDDLWGINLYPDGYDDEGIVEFDSMINVRPRQNNRSRSVEDAKLRSRIQEIVKKWCY